MSCKGEIACRVDESRYRDYGGIKSCNQMKWVGLMNNVRIAAEKIVQREILYV